MLLEQFQHINLFTTDKHSGEVENLLNARLGFFDENGKRIDIATVCYILSPDSREVLLLNQPVLTTLANRPAMVSALLSERLELRDAILAMELLTGTKCFNFAHLLNNYQQLPEKEIFMYMLFGVAMMRGLRQELGLALPTGIGSIEIKIAPVYVASARKFYCHLAFQANHRVYDTLSNSAGIRLSEEVTSVEWVSCSDLRQKLYASDDRTDRPHNKSTYQANFLSELLDKTSSAMRFGLPVEIINHWQDHQQDIIEANSVGV